MSIRFVFGSSITYLAVLLVERGASFLLTPLMTRLLSPADYSAILLIANGSAMLSLLFGSSLAQSLPSLFVNAGSEIARRATSTTILITIAVLLAFAHVAVFLFARSISLYFMQTDAYETTIALGALWSFLSGYSGCLIALVRMTERHRLYLRVQLPALLIQVALVVWLLIGLSMGVNSPYIALSVSCALAVATYVVVFRHWLTGEFRPGIARKGFAIGALLLPLQVANLLTTNSAAFFLTRSGHLDETGLFSIANGLAVLLMVASGCFEMVWTSYVLLRKDEPDLPAMQVRMFKLYSAMLLVAAAGISLFAHEIFLILVGPAFREGYRFVPALAFAYCIYGFASCFAPGMSARLRLESYPWIGFAVSVVFLALCVPLVRQWGAEAVILAMAAGFLTLLVTLQIASQRLMPVPYPWARHGLMWLIAAGLVTVVYPLPLGWQGGAVKLAALAAIASLPFLFGAVRISDLRLAKAAILAPSR